MPSPHEKMIFNKRKEMPDENDLEKSQENWLPELIDHERRRKESRLPALLTHGVVYACGCFGIILLNALSSPRYPWAYYPLAAWGVGMLAHLRSALNSGRALNLIKRLKPATKKDAALISRYARTRGAFAQHLTAYLSVNGYLLGINLITSPGYPWFFYPAVAWGVGLMAHAASTFSKGTIFKRRLRESGLGATAIPEQMPRGGKDGPPRPSARADALRLELLTELKASSELRGRFGELEPFLNTFSERLAALERKEGEIAAVIEREDRPAIEAQIAEFKAKGEAARSPQLKRQYEKSAMQFESHRKSLMELEDRREVIGLQMKSSLSLLNQLKLDVTRVKIMSYREDADSLSALRKKSDEIAAYLDDIETGYDELDDGE
jgi:hypothetical protein